jgi:hypothetical protein
LGGALARDPLFEAGVKPKSLYDDRESGKRDDRRGLKLKRNEQSPYTREVIMGKLNSLIRALSALCVLGAFAAGPARADGE